MAKTRKRTNLSQDDQLLYDQLTTDNKQLVDDQPDAVKKSKLIRQLYSLQGTTTATQPAGGTALAVTPYTGTPTTTTGAGRFEPAIGLETGRFVEPGTGAVIPGTTQRVGGGPVSPMRELRGEPAGFVPRYFSRDADLISTFGRDRIADIQAKMRESGLLGSKYRIGVVDEATKNAWVRLLGEANNSQSDWETALAVGVKTPVGGASQSLPPRVSNPADITKIVQQVASRVLGRSADQRIVDGIVRQFQASQVAAQTGGLPTEGGRTVEPMDLQVLAEQRIQKQAGPEANAYRFAQAASLLFGEASEGIPTGMGQVQP